MLLELTHEQATTLSIALYYFIVEANERADRFKAFGMPNVSAGYESDGFEAQDVLTRIEAFTGVDTKKMLEE